jgi:uncharacterized protein YeaO (DUF488 family)
MIRVKRVYEPASPQDGARFLVDRLWPRGIKKEAVAAGAWLKEVAPSNELRHWYGHEPDKWEEFQRRYAAELESRPESWQPLLAAARQGPVTLLFSARNTDLNNAVALKVFLEKRLGERPRRGSSR